MNIFYHFTTRRFHIKTVELRKLCTELDPTDRRTFNFDHSAIDWDDYYRVAFAEIRRTLLKEDDTTIPKGLQKLKKLFYIDLSFKTICMMGLIFFLFLI